VPVPSQESEWLCICVRGTDFVSFHNFSIGFLFRRCGIVCFPISGKGQNSYIFINKISAPSKQFNFSFYAFEIHLFSTFLKESCKFAYFKYFTFKINLPHRRYIKLTFIVIFIQNQ
jgi:hypothetical protein